MLRAVIFDMDGVIIDTEPFRRKVSKEIFKSLGISVPNELRNSFVGTRVDLIWEELKGRYGLEQSISELTEILKKSILIIFIIWHHKKRSSLLLALSSSLKICIKII